MLEFYEPMLYMSTPEHPNTMGACVCLKDEVDGDILRSVVEVLRERFPYFYVKAAKNGNDLIAVPNPAPMVVRNTWEPIDLNSEASNYHLAAFKYEGKRLAFEITHSLSDGAGMLPYIKSVMYLYLSRKTGQSFDPTGFRMPGEEIPASETGNPFEQVDIDAADEPLYMKPPTVDFFRLNPSASDISQYEKEKENSRIFYLRIPEAQLMQYCRDMDGSPNTFFSVMLTKAARRFDPENDKTISVCVAIDHKAMMGNFDNYRQFANVAELSFTKERPLVDVMKACTVARGQLMLQAQPENTLWTLKQKKQMYAKFDQMPLEMKMGIMEKNAGSARWSIAVSYANSRSFGPLDPYIEELYLLSEPGVTDVMCEIACINKNFFLSIMQNFASERYLDAFLYELGAIGIDYEVMRKEPLHLCGIRQF